MHSRVLLKDPQTGTQSRVTLCYPEDSDPGAGFVSVLSPLGWGLLGQRVGATVHWPTPSGAARAAEILGLLFQPESSGNFAM
jgi:regulator of nucleoside diphosphate kinase